MDGKTGNLEMRINGWLPAGDPPNYEDYEGLWVITSGSGELAGLHGRGTWGGVEFGNSLCTDIDVNLMFRIYAPDAEKMKTWKTPQPNMLQAAK